LAGKKKKKPDWIKIKTEYETTPISTRKLAEKYKVSVSTLQRRCRLEKWTKNKKDFVADVNAKVRQKLAAKKANIIEQELDPALEAASLINKLILDTLKDEKQFKRHLIQMKEKEIIGGSGTEKWWVEEQEFDVVDTKRLRDLAQALKISKELQRLLQGILEPEAEKKLEIEKDRLELEKKKVEKDLAAGEEVFEIIDPFQEEQADES